MNNVKFKKWVIPLLLASLMTAANILYWFWLGNGEHTLAIWLNIFGLIVCGVGWSNGFKLGFTQKQTNND